MTQKRKLVHLVAHILLIIGALVMVLPFVWMILTSLKPSSELGFANWIPSQFVWQNYSAAWQSAPFGTFYRNSIIVTVLTTLGQLVTSAMAGFAFSKMRFFGRRSLFIYVLSAMMIPLQAIIIPVYMTLAGFHWTNTLTGLIVPMIPSAFGTFLFKQFFDEIPTELQEAAFIDGAGRYRILFQIFLPLSKPVIAASGILAFLYVWNDFFYPLIVISSTNMQTIPLGLSVFSTGHTLETNLMMAATTFATIPVLLIFIFLQRYFVEGIAGTGIK